MISFHIEILKYTETIQKSLANSMSCIRSLASYAEISIRQEKAKTFLNKRRPKALKYQ